MNGATALLFARGRASDINVRAAFLHMAADAAISAGVVVAGALILWTGKEWIDPAVSILVSLVILWGSIGLLKEALGMSLMGVPSGIELDDVLDELARLSGVETVHRSSHMATEYDRDRADSASSRPQHHVHRRPADRRSANAPRPISGSSIARCRSNECISKTRTADP